MKATNKFQGHGYHNTPTCLIKSTHILARLVDVYDGDSLTCVIEAYPDIFQRISIRIAGIDACEMTSKTTQGKELAIKARDRTLAFLTNTHVNTQVNTQVSKASIRRDLDITVQLIMIEIHGSDKYGRYLGEAFPLDGTEGISSVLLRERLACVYMGDTKKSEDEMVKLLTL